LSGLSILQRGFESTFIFERANSLVNAKGLEILDRTKKVVALTPLTALACLIVYPEMKEKIGPIVL
jgi:hypothetical protein